MKKFGNGILALALGIALVFSAADASAGDKKRGIVTMSIGTYGPADFPGVACLPTGCVGLLITCAADEGQSPIDVEFYFLRGICDDRGAGGLPACAGRYTGYGEECGRASDVRSSLTVSSNHTTGRFRVCFSDPAAAGDCALSIPLGQIIAEGTTQSHTNHVSGTEILLGVGETVLDGESKWNADGRKQRWSKNIGKRTVVHTQAQINGGTCPSSGPCGLSSTGVSTHK